MAETPAAGGPDQPSGLVIQADDQLADYQAVGEGDDSGPLFEASVDDEAGDEALVQRTDVPKRIPHVVRGGFEQNLLPNGSHDDLLESEVRVAAEGPADLGESCGRRERPGESPVGTPRPRDERSSRSSTDR